MTLLVREYDPAIAFFTDILGFSLIEDTMVTEEKRWVVVAPSTEKGGALLLAKATTLEQSAAIGNQAGGRVFAFLRTTDFDADYQRMRAAGVRFAEEPREEPYGKVVVFYDVSGNKWDLIQARNIEDRKPTII